MRKIISALLIALALLGVFIPRQEANAGGGGTKLPTLYLRDNSGITYLHTSPGSDTTWTGLWDGYSTLVFRYTGLTGVYNPYLGIDLNLYLDTFGPTTGNVVKAVLVFDFNSDGFNELSVDYDVLDLDASLGWQKLPNEPYRQHWYGYTDDFRDGQVTLYIWAEVFKSPIAVRTNATAVQGSQSSLDLPFIEGMPPTFTPTATPTSTSTSSPTPTSTKTATPSPTPTATMTSTAPAPNDKLVEAVRKMCVDKTARFSLDNPCSSHQFSALREANGTYNPMGIKYQWGLGFCPSFNLTPDLLDFDFPGGKIISFPKTVDTVCYASFRFARMPSDTTATPTSSPTASPTPTRTVTRQQVFLPVAVKTLSSNW